MIRLAPFALAVVLAAPAPPAPRPPLPAVLTGYEYVPPPARRTEAERRALIAVAAHADEAPVRRARALTLLLDASEADTRAEALRITRLFLAETTEPFLVRKGVRALGRLQGPAAGLELIARFRAAGADVRLREACAEALRDLGAGFASQRRRFAETERDPVVRAILLAPGPAAPPPSPTPRPLEPTPKGTPP